MITASKIDLIRSRLSQIGVQVEVVDDATCRVMTLYNEWNTYSFSLFYELSRAILACQTEEAAKGWAHKWGWKTFV